MSIFLSVLTICFLSSHVVESKTDEYFTAAAYEFTQGYEFCPHSQDEAKSIVKANLEHFVFAGNIAAEKEADIIVFPEYSIFPECERDITQWFLETIPDPKKERVVPCDHPERFGPQMLTLSCLARNHSMFVQANTGDIHYCDPAADPACPPDGRLQMNTNAVFDREGALVLRYHKEHLWNETAMDTPTERQSPVFQTDFGNYASYVCYDVVLARIVEVVDQPDVDGVVFSTMWENAAPLFMSVQYFQSWAIGNNKTLIAADIQLPGQLALGSGVFHGGEGALVYTFDPDGISKLLVARVPLPGKYLKEPKSSITAIKGNMTYLWEHDGRAVPFEGSESIKNFLKDDYHTIRYHESDLVNFTMVQLTKHEDRISACSNGMCCFLEYQIDRLNENFFFAVFNGTQGSYPPLYWCEEDCMLVRCEDENEKPCSVFPLRSYSVFHHLKIRANFSTKFIYPSVVASKVRMVPLSEWNYTVTQQPDGTYESSIEFDNFVGQNLLEVGLKGRCYDRDSEASFF